MVLKKPYAFLIKHFKLIHLVLCLPLFYLLLKTGDIAQFFSDYIANDYATSIANIAGTYINYFMYFAIILVLLVTVAIYFLMKQKEKSTKFYFLVLFFYILLFVMTTIAYNILSSLEIATVTAQTVRLYRDFSYIMYIPQFFFLGYTLLRGIGFNLQQFNFELDIRELEISDIDSEEFELEIGKDFYKYKRGLRRFIREFRYYFLENRVVFISLVSIVIISIGTIVYLNFGVYHKTYRQSQKISHNGLVVEVLDSELSNMDLGGRVFAEDKYYMAVSVKVTNRGTGSARLDYENFKLMDDKDYIMPTLDRGSYFADLGIPYTRDTEIKVGEEKIYVLTYELNSSMIKKNFELRILESLESTLAGITPVYKEVKLNYNKVFDKKDVRTIPLGKILELSGTRLGLTQLQFKTYFIGNSYSFDYEKCSSLGCQSLKGLATLDFVKYGSNKTLLVVERMVSLDKTTAYYKARGGVNNFVKDFLRVRYVLDGKTKEASMTNVTPKELENGWVFVVPSEVMKAQKVDILLELRGSVYVMNLKES